MGVILLYCGRLKSFSLKNRLEKNWKYLLLPVPALIVVSLQIFATGAVPHYEDEFAYIYQAKALAHCQYPGIKVPKELQNTMQTGFVRINQKETLTGIYPPGLPFMLSPFAFFNAEYLFPPLLTLINTILIFLLIEKLQIKQKILAFLLVCSSVYFLFYSVFFFAQSSSLTMVCLILYRRIQNKTPGPDYIIAVLLFLIRPGDGAIMFTSLALWQFFIYKKPRIHPLLFICAGSALLMLLWHNYLLNGVTGLNSYRRIFPFIGYGFGANIGMNEAFGFNLYEAIKNLGAVLLSLNDALFGWPFMSFLPLLFFVWHLFHKGSDHNNHNFIFFGLILCFCWFSFYFCYFVPGNIIGPRFHYPLFPVLLLFSALAIDKFPEIRPLILVFCLIGFWRISSIYTQDGTNNTGISSEPHTNTLLNSSSVLSFPITQFKLEPDKYVYVIPEYSLSSKPLFSSFYYYNDPFRHKISFIHPKDYQKNPDFFQKKFPNRLRILEAAAKN